MLQRLKSALSLSWLQAKAELAARTALEARVAEMSAELEVASKARLEEQAEELAKQQARVEELETVRGKGWRTSCRVFAFEIVVQPQIARSRP